jgi:hypothetical protein
MRIIAKKKKTQHKLTTLTSCCYLRARGGWKRWVLIRLVDGWWAGNAKNRITI